MIVGIVGLGLIGGSMAKSIKNRTAHTVYGADLNAETMTMARMCGAIDAPLTAENLPECDLVLVAIRPGAAVEWVRRNAEHISKSAILVDLCGVKRTVVEAITPIAAEHGFAYIGGHPMAAGFSLPEENIEEFRRRLNENAKLTEDDFTAKIWIDVPMPLEYITEDLVQEFKRLEPFGQGNEKPLFAQKNLGIRSARVLGRNRNVVRLSLVTEGGFPMDGIWFGQGDEFM